MTPATSDPFPSRASSAWRNRCSPMHREHVQPVLLIAASIIAGTVAWSGHVLLLPFACTFPTLWALARTRRTAACVSAGYFLAASRGLPQGVATFYSSDLWPGLLLWLCASLGFVGVHAVLWTRCERTRPFRYFAAALLMAIPPFGITGWAHPITAAGVLFPAWGWWGLIATTAGLMGLVTRMCRLSQSFWQAFGSVPPQPGTSRSYRNPGKGSTLKWAHRWGAMSALSATVI